MLMNSFKDFINKLRDSKGLGSEESYEAFSLIADGKVDNEEIKEFLLLINEKGITEELLYGAAKSLNERSIKLKAPEGAIDVCGTGGDNSNSLNISTTVAIVLASMGIPVAKHGNKAVSSQSGSADIFSELGINLDKSKEEVEQSLDENNLAFIFAPLYHPAFKHIMPARKELGVRTIFNFLGPLLNPAQVKKQLIGCSDKKMAKIMARVCYLMEKHVWVVVGEDGMDEMSISANTFIYKTDKDGNVVEEIFNPEEHDIKKRPISLIAGKDPKYNAEKLIKLLKGEIGDEKMQAYHDIVCLNSAAALIIAGKSKTFQESIDVVSGHIKSEKVLKFLRDVQ